jgi:hypothetical protein
MPVRARTLIHGINIPFTGYLMCWCPWRDIAKTGGGLLENIADPSRRGTGKQGSHLRDLKDLIPGHSKTGENRELIQNERGVRSLKQPSSAGINDRGMPDVRGRRTKNIREFLKL